MEFVSGTRKPASGTVLVNNSLSFCRFVCFFDSLSMSLTLSCKAYLNILDRFYALHRKRYFCLDSVCFELYSQTPNASFVKSPFHSLIRRGAEEEKEQMGRECWACSSSQNGDSTYKRRSHRTQCYLYQ